MWARWNDAYARRLNEVGTRNDGVHTWPLEVAGLGAVFVAASLRYDSERRQRIPG